MVAANVVPLAKGTLNMYPICDPLSISIFKIKIIKHVILLLEKRHDEIKYFFSL